MTEMQETLSQIKGKEHTLENRNFSQRKLINSDSQKKIILHVPEKEVAVIKNTQSDNNEKLLTDIKDLERKYSTMQSEIEGYGTKIGDDETILVKNDIDEMNQLMNEFENKKLTIYKQKFQHFIHKILKKFHTKKKKLILQITQLKQELGNVIALNKEYTIKIEVLQVTYTKLLAEFEELKEINKNLEEELLKYQKNEMLLRTEIEKIKALLSSKEKECIFFREKSETLESEKQHLTEENKKLMLKLIKYESENALYKLQIEKMNEIYNERVLFLKNEITDLRKTNKGLMDDINEIKKENLLIKVENQELSKERDKWREDYQELELLLKNKGGEISHLHMMIERLEQRPPREIITQVPVEKIIEKIVEIPVEKIIDRPVDRIVEVPVDRIIEMPKEHIVYRENNELIEEFHELQQIKNTMEHEIRRLIDERNMLEQRNMEGECLVEDLRTRINRMMEDIREMQIANQEKNVDIAKYIESLINQNKYLENMMISR